MENRAFADAGSGGADTPFDTFNEISPKALEDLEHAKRNFIDFIMTADVWGEMQVTRRIIDFHLVEKCRTKFRAFCKEHGAHVKFEVTEEGPRRHRLYHGDVTITRTSKQVYLSKQLAVAAVADPGAQPSDADLAPTLDASRLLCSAPNPVTSGAVYVPFSEAGADASPRGDPPVMPSHGSGSTYEGGLSWQLPSRQASGQQSVPQQSPAASDAHVTQPLFPELVTADMLLGDESPPSAAPVSEHPSPRVWPEPSGQKPPRPASSLRVSSIGADARVVAMEGAEGHTLSRPPSQVDMLSGGQSIYSGGQVQARTAVPRAYTDAAFPPAGGRGLEVRAVWDGILGAAPMQADATPGGGRLSDAEAAARLAGEARARSVLAGSRAAPPLGVPRPGAARDVFDDANPRLGSMSGALAELLAAHTEARCDPRAPHHPAEGRSRLSSSEARAMHGEGGDRGPATRERSPHGGGRDRRYEGPPGAGSAPGGIYRAVSAPDRDPGNRPATASRLDPALRLGYRSGSGTYAPEGVPSLSCGSHEDAPPPPRGGLQHAVTMPSMQQQQRMGPMGQAGGVDMAALMRLVEGEGTPALRVPAHQTSLPRPRYPAHQGSPCDPPHLGHPAARGAEYGAGPPPGVRAHLRTSGHDLTALHAAAPYPLGPLDGLDYLSAAPPQADASALLLAAGDQAVRHPAHNNSGEFSRVIGDTRALARGRPSQVPARLAAAYGPFQGLQAPSRGSSGEDAPQRSSGSWSAGGAQRKIPLRASSSLPYVSDIAPAVFEPPAAVFPQHFAPSQMMSQMPVAMAAFNDRDLDDAVDALSGGKRARRVHGRK